MWDSVSLLPTHLQASSPSRACLPSESMMKGHWLAMGACCGGSPFSTSQSAILVSLLVAAKFLHQDQASSSSYSCLGQDVCVCVCVVVWGGWFESTHQCLSAPERLISLWNSAQLDLYPDLLNVLYNKITKFIVSHHYHGTNGFLWHFAS